MIETVESQDSPRHNRCFFRAFAYFDKDATAVDCVVRDISDAGARLEFSKPQNVSGALELHIPVKGQSFHAKVQWHDDNQLGIAFHGTESVADIGLDRRMDRVEVGISMLRQAVKLLQKNADKKTEAA